MSMFKSLYHSLLKILPDKQAVQLMHFRSFGRIPDLKNPKTFNEKIAWRKLYQHDPRFTVFADKVAVKDEIAKQIGQEYIIPTLWHGENPKDIPFDTLPCPYVIKTNNGFGDKVFVTSPDQLDREKVIRHFSEKGDDPHFIMTREWGYKDIPLKIIVEKMLETPDGSLPLDYKFFVYRGKVEVVQISDRNGDEPAFAYYTPEWKKLDVRLGEYPLAEREAVKPENFGDMVRIAGHLGTDFDFVRVDLYSIGGKIFFGEMTFFPNAGLLPFHPNKIWDLKLGEPWKIDKTGVNA